MKHGKRCPLRGFDALPVYQLATLIEAVLRISLSRCTVNSQIPVQEADGTHVQWQLIFMVL